MHFSQAVAIIQSQVGIIKGVHVIYSDTVRIFRELYSSSGFSKNVEINYSWPCDMHVLLLNTKFLMLLCGDIAVYDRSVHMPGIRDTL